MARHELIFSPGRWSRFLALLREVLGQFTTIRLSDGPWQMPFAAVLSSGPPLQGGVYLGRIDYAAALLSRRARISVSPRNAIASPHGVTDGIRTVAIGYLSLVRSPRKLPPCADPQQPRRPPLSLPESAALKAPHSPGGAFVFLRLAIVQPRNSALASFVQMGNQRIT